MNVKLLGGLVAALAMSAPALSTPAGTISYDSSLQFPGVYFGGGNANDHFTVGNSNGVELGLTTVLRYTGNITPDAGTAIYHAPIGDTLVAGKHGSSWGFSFSLNGAGGEFDLANLTTQLTIVNRATLASVTFDPLNQIPDNFYYGSTGAHANAALAGDYGFQNSAAFSYANGNNALNAVYDITFSAACTATCIGGAGDLGSVMTTVVVGAGAVPEPASWALMIAGFGLIGTSMRRRAYVTRTSSV